MTKIFPRTENWLRVIQLAKSCSWQGDGSTLAEMMEKMDFTEYECVFGAFEKQMPIGFCTVTKNDYVRLPGIEPWLGFLFISETHRGKRIGKLLLDEATKYIGQCGFQTAYLSTEHLGLYEKYGFQEYTTVRGPRNESLVIYYKEVNKQ